MIPAFRLPRVAAFLAAALLVLTAAPGWAAVSITFYSKELGSSFPHAFVILQGTPDRGGARIEEDYGFTAKTISPAKPNKVSGHSSNGAKPQAAISPRAKASG